MANINKSVKGYSFLSIIPAAPNANPLRNTEAIHK